MSNNVNDNNPPPSVSFHFVPPSGSSNNDNDLVAISKKNMGPIIAKVFEDHSITEGSLLSTSEMGRFRSALTEKSSLHPKTLEEECEKLRQQIREDYLGNQVLHALTGHKAGSGIPAPVNNLIDNLNINDLKHLSQDIHSLIKLKKKNGELFSPGEVFFMAVTKRKNLLVRFLCAFGPNCPAVSQGVIMQSDMFPLQMAVRDGNPELVKVLLEAGSPVDMQDIYGNTALFYDSKGAIISVLIDAGANVNHQNKQGATAFMTAIHNNNIDVVESLCDAKNLDIYIQDNEGKTALTLAFTEEMITLLQQYVNYRKARNI